MKKPRVGLQMKYKRTSGARSVAPEELAREGAEGRLATQVQTAGLGGRAAACKGNAGAKLVQINSSLKEG
jgi:hypothetical protein